MPSVRLVVADDRHVSYLDRTRLFPDIDYSVKVDAATQSSDASNNHQSYDSKVYGRASVFPAFIRKMQQATGRIVNLPDGYSFHDHDVQTLYLTESSVRHTDVRVEGLTPLEDSEESLTAFYVQESTADAYFETDDDELCIPYVEGSAIFFNGGLPHQSIVKSGAVKLVGPFLLSTLESVGAGPVYCGTNAADARKCEVLCGSGTVCPSGEQCHGLQGPCIEPPSLSPSVSPQAFPSTAPSSSPQAFPSTAPSSSPQVSPSTAPSSSPQVSPSTAPSSSPQAFPSTAPSSSPQAFPSTAPSSSPQVSPSTAPSLSPSESPAVSSSKSSKGPKAGKVSSSLQVQQMKSSGSGSSLSLTSLVGISLVSIVALGTFTF